MTTDETRNALNAKQMAYDELAWRAADDETVLQSMSVLRGEIEQLVRHLEDAKAAQRAADRHGVESRTHAAKAQRVAALEAAKETVAESHAVAATLPQRLDDLLAVFDRVRTLEQSWRQSTSMVTDRAGQEQIAMMSRPLHELSDLESALRTAHRDLHAPGLPAFGSRLAGRISATQAALRAWLPQQHEES